jgi:prepilin-type processing-associated H-X9-DG protein
MYKIIGADGNQYGPISAEQMQQWIAEHRVNGETQVLIEGANEWRLLSTFPEFSTALAAATSPPPTPGLQLSQTPMAASAQPTYPGSLYAPVVPVAPKTSGLAIGSLVSSILGPFTCGIGSLVGIILGIIALNDIRKSGGRLTGKGLAIAGICVAALIFVPIGAGMFLPAFAKAKEKAQRINCINNLRQLGQGTLMYEGAKGRLPDADKWGDQLVQYVAGTNVFFCPSAHGHAYGYNAKLSGKKLSQVNPETVMFFEIEGGWNSSGGPEAMLATPRHGGYNVGFVDGSVRQVSSMNISSLRWDP